MTFASYSAYIPKEEIFSTTGPQIREDTPIHRVSSTGGNMTESSEKNYDRGNEGQLNPNHGDGSWKATARTTTGRVATEITGDTLVEFDGVQAKASFWLSEGRLTKAADGSFTENTNVAPTEHAIEGDHLPISDQTMDQVNQLLEPLPQSALNSIQAQATGMATGRLTDASLTAKFAQATGLDMADSAARLTVLKAVYQGQADQALQSRHGIGEADRAQFYQWCRENKQGQLADAITKQLNRNDVSGWAPLANQWMAANPPSLTAIKAAGNIPVRGNEIFIQGQWLSPSAAARAGLV